MVIIRDMQIKLIKSYHLTSIETANIKKSKHNQHWPRCGEKGTFAHSWWKCKLL
jgi:hypothetical protein